MVEPNSSTDNATTDQESVEDLPTSPVPASSLGDFRMDDDRPSTKQSFYQLDPNYISVEKISGFIWFLIVLLGSLSGIVLNWLLNDDTTLIHYGITATVLLFNGWLFLLPFFWPAAKYRHFCWALDDSGLEIHRGVFWKLKIAVPVARVQHADVSQGPLQRQYGIGTLTIHTAGTRNASVDLPGLNHDIALQLRDHLIRQGIKDDTA